MFHRFRQVEASGTKFEVYDCLVCNDIVMGISVDDGCTDDVNAAC